MQGHCPCKLAFLHWLLYSTVSCQCRPLAKDGVNRSFAAVYDGQHSPDAAKDAADRLHLILQREDALVARNSGEILANTNMKMFGDAWCLCLAFVLGVYAWHEAVDACITSTAISTSVLRLALPKQIPAAAVLQR